MPRWWQDGPEVVITYDWQVSARKPLLRRLTWLRRPVFAANHRWAMARGEESLHQELRRRRATSEVIGSRNQLLSGQRVTPVCPSE